LPAFSHVRLFPSLCAACAFCADESLAVGGQAVMEGVMMRNGPSLSVAVRKADGEIIAMVGPWRSCFGRSLAERRWLRGFPVLVDTLVNGIKALNLSAAIAAEAEGQEIKGWHLALTLLAAIGLALLLFVVLPHLLTVGLNFLSISGDMEGLSFHLWDGALKFAMFLGYIALISLVPDIARVFAYHGAEHKSISAYENKEDPLTPGAAAAYSRLHPRCGTTFLLFVLGISILLHALTVPALLYFWTPESALRKHTLIILLKLLLMLPVSALAYEAIRSAARIKNPLIGFIMRAPGLALQLLTTREPDYRQLEVALVALREALGEEAEVRVVTAPYTRRGLYAAKEKTADSDTETF
jgi:uncharacterized protein YqhQ